MLRLYSLMRNHIPTFENIRETKLLLPAVHLISKAFSGSNSPSLFITVGDFASTRATSSLSTSTGSTWKSTIDLATSAFCSGRIRHSDRLYFHRHFVVALKIPRINNILLCPKGST